MSRAEEWSTYTPDGQRLFVWRERETWVAQCGSGGEARNELLDVALIDAIRHDHDVVDHEIGVDYGEWTREQADAIARDLFGSVR